MLRAIIIWTALALVALWTVLQAASSPFLAWRDAIYIASGFAGILALLGLLLQPLLAAGELPGLRGIRGRQLHAGIGAAIVVAVIGHVTGLWMTSPPDVVDALLLRSPTPFSIWGVLAMWALFVTAALARLRPRLWRVAHKSLAGVIVLGTVIHALLIEGTMGTASKILLCGLVLAVTIAVVLDVPQRARRRRARQG